MPPARARLKKGTRKPPKWKRDERKRKKKQWGWLLRVGKRSLTFVLVLLVVGVMVADFRASRWSGGNRLTVVLAGPALSVFSYDPQNDGAVLVRIPDKTLVDVAGGYGQYRAGALIGLDDQEGQRGTLVADSVAKTFGIIVDGYIISNRGLAVRDQGIDNKGSLGRFLGQAFLGRLSNRVKTNLSAWDLVRIWRAEMGVRRDKLEILDLGGSRALFETRLPDGSLAYELDSLALSVLAQEWFGDEAVAAESMNVLVVNTTGTSGLGKILGQMLTAAGVHVVAVEDSDTKLSLSEIRFHRKALPQKTFNHRRHSVRRLPWRAPRRPVYPSGQTHQRWQ